MSLQNIQNRILRDIKIELDDEFDRNFTRQAFFDQPWAARKPSFRSGNILTDTGQLRRSIQSQVAGNTITYSSDLPYASIHNSGGEIEVTERMRRFFWAKFYEARGGITTRASGAARASRANERLTAEASSWRAMALKKAGSKINIPKRQFIGEHPVIDEAIEGIITERVEEFAQQIINNITR